MSLIKRALTLLVAAAVALAPMGAAAASAGSHSRATATISAKTEVGKAAQSDMPCCPSEHAKSDCSQLCLQKCFSSLAVMPADARAPAFEVRQFRLAAAESPPQWTTAPQPPPPRA